MGVISQGNFPSRASQAPEALGQKPFRLYGILKFLVDLKKKNYVWIFCLHVCLYAPCVPGTCRGQTRVSGLLEVE